MESALVSLIATGISAGGVPAIILGLAFIGWKFFGTVTDQNAAKSINNSEMNGVLWERLKATEVERDKYRDMYYKLLGGITEEER